jgi:hypothetical protein
MVWEVALGVFFGLMLFRVAQTPPGELWDGLKTLLMVFSG